MVDRFHQCEVEKNNDNKQQKTKKLGLEIIFEENMQISWNAFFDVYVDVVWNCSVN